MLTCVGHIIRCMFTRQYNRPHIFIINKTIHIQLKLAIKLTQNQQIQINYQHNIITTTNQ